MPQLPVINELPGGWQHQDSNSDTHIYRKAGWGYPETLEVLVIENGSDEDGIYAKISVEYTQDQIIVNDESIHGTPEEINSEVIEMMDSAEADVSKY
jgi:hypothetical protein